jgi:hypothetical protein
MTELFPAPVLAHRDSVAFCRHMLPRTSRTFALNVPLLPRPLDDVVAMAYLLCRVADTIEDEAAVPANVQAELLGELGALVALPEDMSPSMVRYAVVVWTCPGLVVSLLETPFAADLAGLLQSQGKPCPPLTQPREGTSEPGR